MTTTSAVQQYLPEHLQELAETFEIPEQFLASENQLIIMILESRSIDTQEEKQNWFNLLPLMNEEQLEKLREILNKEKTKLAEIEEKYKKKKQEIQEKYQKDREDTGSKERISEIKGKESAVAAKEAEEAEDLLDMI